MRPRLSSQANKRNVCLSIASDLMVCSIEVDISLSTFSGNGMLIELDLIDNLGNSMTIRDALQISRKIFPLRTVQQIRELSDT